MLFTAWFGVVRSTFFIFLATLDLSDCILVSSHVFSNHKGGCGKTTNIFHCCAEYAMRHPDEKILVIDTTLRGDLSELLFGGDKGASGKQTLRAVSALRSTTRLLMQAASVSAASEATVKAGSSLDELIKKLFPKERGGDAVSCLFDIMEQVVHVSDFNPAIPANLYLCPGGSGPQTSYPPQQRAGIASTIRKASYTAGHPARRGAAPWPSLEPRLHAAGCCRRATPRRVPVAALRVLVTSPGHVPAGLGGEPGGVEAARRHRRRPGLQRLHQGRGPPLSPRVQAAARARAPPHDTDRIS